MLHESLPHRQTDQQSHTNNADPNTGFLKSGFLADQRVNERSGKHHKYDKLGTENSERAREELQPVKRHVEKPFRLDDFRSRERIGARPHRGRQDCGQHA